MRLRYTTFLRRQLIGPLFFLVSLACLTVSGCGDDGKVERFPVRGSVNVDGRPAEGVLMFFCPVNPTPEIERLRPVGFTSPDGKFELTTFDRADGAPAGEYKVLFQWPGKSTDTRDGGGAGPDRFRGRYNNLDTAQITAKVDGPTDLPPFELKSK
jgi:hypothetical protein